jgi:ankyrin repeat protein
MIPHSHYTEIYPDANIIAQERSLLSIARPTAPLTTADAPDHPFSWLRENDTYKSWAQQRVPQILYLHGSSGGRQAAEFAFYDMDNTKRGTRDVNEMVLYFTFDRHDIRHDTTEDMLTTFLAQIICHNPSLAEFVVGQFDRLAIDRSWSDYDLLTWFEYYRVRGQVDGVSCVINCFEECEEQSRKDFLGLVTKLSKAHERPWRIVVTSRERGTLSEELKEWPSIDLNSASPSSSVSEKLWMDSDKQLFRYRPELKDNQEVPDELLKISKLDPSIRDLVLAQVMRHSQWPRKATVESIFGSLADLSASEIFKRVVDAIPEHDRAFAFRALGWILCAPRPLTVWELGMALFIGSEADDGEKARPDYGYVEAVTSKITECFTGTAVLEVHEIRITRPEFRQVIQENLDAMPNWNGRFVETVTTDIVKTCLNFLLRPHATKIVEDIYGKGKEKSSVMDLPTVADRCNFCSYAVLYWLDHLQQVPSNPELNKILHEFIRSKSVPIWSKAYWALANPITRSPEHFSTIYPILTGRGLWDLAEPLRENDEDISAGLIEACLNGYREAVDTLLNRIQHSEVPLQHALTAAGSNGNEDIWKLVIAHVRKYHETFSWPAALLSRASWLGLKDVVTELLEAGCDPNPPNALQNVTPLHLASRTGHLDVVKVLLEHKADAKRVDDNGRNGVHAAAVYGHAQVIELFVKESDVDINARDTRDNLSALYIGSLWGNWKVVETLLKLGADPNLGELETGLPQWNPIVCAVNEGHILCIKALLEAGADPNYVGPGGTPVQYAVDLGRIDIVRLLIENKADLQHEKIDQPILMVALNSTQIEGGDARLEMVRLLLDNGAKVDVFDGVGEMPLSRALYTPEKERFPLVAYLISRGADVNGLTHNYPRTALHLAAAEGELELVKLLIEKGADVNMKATDEYPWSPLHLAVDNPKVLQLLLENKANPASRHEKVQTVLMDAVTSNQVESIRLLMQHHAPLEDVDDSYLGFTPLALAAIRGHAEAFRLLADGGANMNHMCRGERTILHLAFQGNDALPACLEYRPSLDDLDEDGDTALNYMQGTTPLENVKLLVRAGANLSIQNKEGLTPLGNAIRHNDEAAEYLLSKASPDVLGAVSHIHGSVLHIACTHSKVDLVKQLLQKDVDVNLVVNSVVGTPLQSAILCMDSPAAYDDRVEGPGSDSIAAIVDLLIEAGANVSAVGGQFGTAVAAAALKGSATLLGNIIEKGGKLDVPDPMGRLPIHLASVHGNDHFGVIVDAGGDTLPKDKVGRTPLHWAAQSGQVSVVERVLEEAGDKVVDQVDNDGWTPLCWAARGSGTHFSVLPVEKQVDVIKKLVEHGASVDYSIPGQDKRPIDIARYHSADKEVLDLLTLESKEKSKSKNAGEGEGEEEDDNGDDDGGKTLYVHYSAFCAYCLSVSFPFIMSASPPPYSSAIPSRPTILQYHFAIQRVRLVTASNYLHRQSITGLLHKCETCADFSLCYKCYESRTAFHSTDHTFEEVGQEFITRSEGTSSSSGPKEGSGAADAEHSEEDESSQEDTTSEEESEEEEEEDEDDE